MISVEAHGRLGNHMFQFAFGLAAASRLGTDFAMNDELLRPLFDLGGWNGKAQRARRSVRFHITKRLAPSPVVKVGNDEDPDLVIRALQDGVHYAGFFQSLRYFENVASGVRSAFHPHEQHVEAFRTRYHDLAANPYICCHVRRTDYEDAGVHLPVSYYRDCLRLAGSSGDTPIVFVGDDLSEVEVEFAEERGVRFERNDEIVDMQLLTHASTVVTSNSSFGWWGSWLGAAHRPIFAPEYWLGVRIGTETPRTVIPQGWNRVQVSMP
ncbi:MAG: alpha-1,2-fucosyltransferase [Actinobacteria bacterium]|nr:alpha-1,2-fucosyltransferase [Actinomycetota bacterium]